MINNERVCTVPSPCRDGFASAAIMALVFQLKDDHRPVTYVGVDPSKLDETLDRLFESPPVSGASLYSVDVSFKRAPYNRVMQRFDDVCIIDHHKTTREEFSDSCPSNIVFDNDLCGCTLTWRHFMGGEPTPLLLKYMQDRDLWRTDMPSSEVVNEGLFHLLPCQYEDGRLHEGGHHPDE